MPGNRDVRGLLLESVVIIASILAAFSLDRWWESRLDVAAELDALEALRPDFEDAAQELERRLGFHRRIEHSIASTLEELQRARANGESRIMVRDTAIAWAYVAPTIQLGMGSLTGLIRSGRLEIVRNATLRAKLSAWDGLLGELTEEEVRSQEYLQELDSVLRTRNDVTPFMDNRRGDALLRGESTDRAGHESPLMVDAATIGVFARRLLILQHGITEYAPVRAEVDAILALIAMELAGR